MGWPHRSNAMGFRLNVLVKLSAGILIGGWVLCAPAHAQFGGIGIELTMENGRLKVVAPIDEAPAAKAGILTNDIITHVDDEPLLGLTLNQAVERLRGPADSTVKLRIARKGQEKPIEMVVNREIIRVRPIRARVEGDDIGYIRITQFNAQTVEDLRKAIDETASDKLKGYVIDLRNSPGGLLDQAVSAADAFLEQGEIVSTRGRSQDDVQRFHAKPGDLAKSKPIIVLINGGSAGAAEVVAGALQDQKRAKLVGSRSFGMGSVQTVIPLGDGQGAIRLTTARYFTPTGRSIQAHGIKPDIEVMQDVPEEKKPSPATKGGEEPGGLQSYVPPDPTNDKALRRALEILRSASDKG
jgi:carboxyl-terminal processing protease